MAELDQTYVEEGPSVGYPQGRQDEIWVPVTEEVPADGQKYVREYQRWLPAVDGGGISDVPPYPPIIWGRTTGRWVELPSQTGIIVADLPPDNVPPNQMWWDSAWARLYLLYADNANGGQCWIQIG
jgi:hypothetical protein